MTDSLKLAEMQRTSIELERQRHLANWFIKSSQHMATPPSLNPTGGNSNNSNSKAQKSSSGVLGKNGNGTITTTNPLFFFVSGQKPPPPPPQINGGTIALSRSQIFTSQTNLPLQIVTSSAQEGHKPKLRRFNSHDTSANMFSVADFENARLARRNEIEMKQRQQQRLKMNSLSSGGDYSTGDSKGSKYSNESQPEPLPADVFLERYSLPRVVRISQKPKFSHETLQSSSSNGSSSTNSSTSITNKTNDGSKHNGELYLLYRYLRQRKIYHGINSKSGSGSRKKGVMIPQEFPGYFSLVNDKGLSTATLYTTLVQLVRECVHKFISVDNLPAFMESQSTDTFPPRSHYVKSTARGGQIFRLLAVFEDGKQENSSSSNKNTNTSGREKEKGRYAQLINENRQILYVSLTAKGKFYEIEPGIPQIIQKNLINDDTPKKLNPDCVHRLNSIITNEIEFPINVKFISGPSNSSSLIPENLTINRVSTENVLIVCPIEDVESKSTVLHLKKLHITPEMTLIKCFLGFENEQRMFSNHNVQNILKYCQFNADNFVKLIEFETINRPERSSSRSKVDGLKILKPLSLPKLLRREKSTIAHEKEDSIIFLSKNDLANLEAKDEQMASLQTLNGLSGEIVGMSSMSSANNFVGATATSATSASHESTGKMSDKMKVFQPTKKKWFRRNDKHNSLASLDIDAQAKRMSMERYNDMSKLLQERFGEALLAESSSTDERPNSELGCSEKQISKIQKSLSLQDVEFIDKPDLVPVNFTGDLHGSSHDSVNHFNGNIEGNSNTFVTDQQNNSSDCVASSYNGDINCSDNPSGNQERSNQQQQSFISEKMYTEFHVKTRQYSKSSSSLHQLLHFAVPQRMNIVEMKKHNLKSMKEQQHQQKQLQLQPTSSSSPQSSSSLILSKKYDSNIINSLEGELTMIDSSATAGQETIIDDLPYSNVRDSLLTTDGSDRDGDFSDGAKAVSYINIDDDTKENIYAEICHDSGAVSRVQINVISEPILVDHLKSSSTISATSNNYNTTSIPIASTSTGPVVTSSTDNNSTVSQLHISGASTDNIYNTIK